MNRPFRLAMRRTLAALLSALIALGPIASPAYAAVTSLADEPIAFRPTAEPNIVLTVDDSTSMLSDFLPDYIIGKPPGSVAGINGFCRSSTGEMSVACGSGGSVSSPAYIFSYTNVPYPAYAAGYSNSSVPDWMRVWPAPMHSNALNRIYYDPSLDYRPAAFADGSSYPNSTFTNAVADPWAGVLKYANLSSTVLTGLYCNTDWPLSTNPIPPAGGNYCRINGTDYSALPSAPEKADYQYPWTKNSGALTSPLVAAEEKYFWRNGGNYTNWCEARNFGVFDTAAPSTSNTLWYPQTCTATAYTCPGGTYTPPPSVPQTCFLQSNRMGCDPAVDTDYTPAGCQRSPLHGGPPGVNPGQCTGGPECLPCSCRNARVIGKNANCRLASTAPPGSGGSNASCGCNNSPIGTACTLGSCLDFTPAGPGTCSNAVTPVPTRFNCVAMSGPSCATNTFVPALFRNYAINASGQATAANQGPTILADSNGNGDVCRHNNQAYPDGTTPNRRNYHGSHVKYNRAVSGGAGCGAVASSWSIPRHYWKTSVEWCTTRITAVNDKWRNFGQAGSCQDEHDSAHPYPRFYKWGVPKTDPAYLDNYAYPAFERVDLNSALTNCSAESRALNPGAYCSHRYWKVVAGVGQWVQVDRTFAQESQNYANWFSYYRTRILAAKTVISRNFTYLGANKRLAFHTLNNGAGSFLDFAAFDAAHKSSWYAKLFGVTIPMGQQTPIIDAMVRIGEDFKNGGNPALPGSGNPITLSCQKNYHMLFTDGIVNQAALPAVRVGNQDNTVLTLPQPIVVTPPIAIGGNWPPLYRETNPPGVSDSMSDYSTYYWVTDLRPGMTNNVPTGRDPAPWQHLNFAALSLGTESILPASSPSATEGRIAAGTLTWPVPSPNTWAPTSGGVEDLWHAAVNARGRFVNAKNSVQLGRGIADMLADIDSPSGTNVGATFTNPNLSATNNHTYIGEFVQGWGGRVRKVRVNPADASFVANAWDAEQQLILQTTPTIAMPTPWYTNRRIVAVNDTGASAVQFLPTTLPTTHLDTLGSTAGAQASVIEFLRGRRDNEGSDDGQFRIRASPLGDIVDSQPTYVGPPSWPYLDGNDPGYSAFASARSLRPGRVYVGANDGMLHAFDDVTGDEAWAFIPRDFFRSAPSDKEGLVGLSYQPGGLPIYEHRYYVNSTPRIVDVDFGNGAGDWRTLLVGGLGKGGRSYYALDVTNPAAFPTEASMALNNLFKWEFRHAQLGYTYGRATIVKTRAYGWVVIVPSGYNNPDGIGRIFVLRASDGTLLQTMCTGDDGGKGCSAAEGTATNPIGLAHIEGYTKDYRDQTVEQVYGGDLYGNFWRFDLSDPDHNNWRTQKLARFVVGATPQPITTPPQIEVDVQNGVDRWVFVGTGKLLHESDLTDTSLQSFYAIRDGTADQPWPIGAPVTRADLDVVSGIAGLGTGVVPDKGWYDDLTPPPVGQRIITPVQSAISLVGYIASYPGTDQCNVSPPARIFVRFIGNGESALVDSFDSPVEYFDEPEGGAGMSVVALPGTGNVPDIRIVLTTKRGNVKTFKIRLPGVMGQNRLNWRGLGQ